MLAGMRITLLLLVLLLGAPALPKTATAGEYVPPRTSLRVLPHMPKCDGSHPALFIWTFTDRTTGEPREDVKIAFRVSGDSPSIVGFSNKHGRFFAVMYPQKEIRSSENEFWVNYAVDNIVHRIELPCRWVGEPS
jgi:hypothetical protein